MTEREEWEACVRQYVIAMYVFAQWTGDRKIAYEMGAAARKYR